MSKIRIRTFENPWGGVSIFQKCLNFKWGLLKADGGSHFGDSLTFFQQKCEIFTKMKDLHENLTKKCKSAHNSLLLNTYAHLYLFQIFEPGGSDIVKNVSNSKMSEIDPIGGSAFFK